MRFLSRAERATIVVPGRQQTKIIMPNGREVVSQPLRAKFRDHKFDSRAAQKAMAWTDDDRKAVEQAIMENEQWGVTLHSDQIIADSQPKAKKLRLKCTAFDPDRETGEAVQCPNYAEPGQDYCTDHLRMVKASIDINADPNAEGEGTAGDVPDWMAEEAVS